MGEITIRLLTGCALAYVTANQCFAYFTQRRLLRDPSKLTFFFLPANLMYRQSLRIWRYLFSSFVFGGILIAFLGITQDPLTLKQTNNYLLSVAAEVMPKTVAEHFISPIKEGLHLLVRDGDSWKQVTDDSATEINYFGLVALLGVISAIFAPHLIVFYGFIKDKVHRLMQFDGAALEQVDDAARRFLRQHGNNPVVAATELERRFGKVYIPPEITGRNDPTILLKYYLISVASQNAPEKGFGPALDEVVGAHGGSHNRPPTTLSLTQIAAAGGLYLVGCILYTVIVPLAGTVSVESCDGPPQIHINLMLTSFTADWVGYRGIEDLILQIAQFSLIVVIPLIMGMYSYNTRRLRLASLESSNHTTQEVVSKLFVLAFVLGAVFVVVEGIRFYFEAPLGFCDMTNKPPATPQAHTAAEALRALARNGVLTMLLTCLPLALLVIWARTLEKKKSIAFAATITSVASAIFGYMAMATFDAMARVQDKIDLSLALHNALLYSYLVLLTGISIRLFLSELTIAYSGASQVPVAAE